MEVYVCRCMDVGVGTENVEISNWYPLFIQKYFCVVRVDVGLYIPSAMLVLDERAH